jgi:hypothetical protein
VPLFARKEAARSRVIENELQRIHGPQTTEDAMKLRDIFFGSKGTNPASSEPAKSAATSVKLDFDALDDCVGGKPDVEGVGCYVRSTQPHDQ